MIDGIDIRKIKISSLRRHFGQMLQDVFLFSGTIRSNIVLREENISDDEIMKVCRYVNADHFIDKLEKCDAVEWRDKSWRITEVGRAGQRIVADLVAAQAAPEAQADEGAETGETTANAQ